VEWGCDVSGKGTRQGGAGARAAFWLSWSLAGLCVAMFLASIPLYLLAR
jgi:hypothetical protein